MATYDAPLWLLNFAQFEFGIQKAGTQFRGPFNGTPQAADFVAERWVVSITLPPRHRVDSGAVEAFINRLVGGVNRVRLPHIASGTKDAVRVPRGTMRGAPVLSGSIARGALALPITTSAGATVWAGDMLGCGGQLFQVADDAVANGSGAVTVNVVNRVRVGTASGTAVVWNAPTAEFLMPALAARHAHTPAILKSGQIDLEEFY